MSISRESGKRRIGTENTAIESASNVYRALAIGDYVLGRTDLATAARTADLSCAELLATVRDCATGQVLPGHRNGSASSPVVSVVVPVFNNADTIAELCTRLVLALAPVGSCEILLVDDGSADDSVTVIREQCQRHPNIRMIRLSRNFGQQAALTAGLDAARGKAVVMMDADLQDPPELIGDMVEKWRAGNEVVMMVRRKRKENVLRRWSYSAFYRIFRYLAEMDVSLDTGDFSLLDRAVVDVLRNMPERARFLRGLRSWSGFRQTSIDYDRPERASGRSQYTLRRLIRLAMDGLLSFSTVPLRLTAFLGIGTALIGLLTFGFVLAARLSSPALPIGWASSLAAVLLVGGAQLTTVGVVGAYIARIYAEVKGRPLYIVMERQG